MRPDTETGLAAADSDDRSSGFMPKDARGGNESVMDFFDVRRTNATAGDLDKEFVRANRGNRNGLQAQIIRTAIDNGAHGFRNSEHQTDLNKTGAKGTPNPVCMKASRRVRIRAVTAKIILPVLFVLVFAISRIPGLLPLGFSPVYALVFCAGVYFRGAMAWWLPLGIMVATDMGLNFFYYHPKYGTPLFRPELLLNYAIYAGLIGLGKWFGQRAAFLKLLFGGVLGALIFYLLTNTLSWLETPDYAKTIAGWIQALFTGLPGYPSSWEFFRNTLLSGAIFTALFVAAARLAEESPAEKTAGVAEAENEDTAEEPAKG
jgi:hypothetical protein